MKRLAKGCSLHTRHRICQSLLQTVLAAVLFLCLYRVTSAPSIVNYISSLDRAAAWSHIRLPQFIRPSNYKIAFTLDKFAFAGTVSIDINVAQASKVIVLHNVDMALEYVSLISKSETSPKFIRFDHNKKMQYSVLVFENEIVPGDYNLNVAYNATLSKAMSGFYSSSYVSKEGVTKYLATTQFEPTDARKAFPCFDEPAMKSIFEITINVEKQYHALSNMPIKQKKHMEHFDRYEFEPTVVMSSYLVAFIVSDFESISTVTKNGIKVSVYTPPSKTSLGQYALEAGTKILDFYQEQYGIDFPLPKCDLVAVPDFATGAMENWGLITFRDTALLWDPKTSTADNKERVAEVVAHELAHQWFGNLVTMRWWSDLWLNEGFAEFMEYKGVNAIEPDWKMLDSFIPADLVRALHADESAFTHSIALPVEDPSEINNIFDDISYGKGSSVIRMLESWMSQKFGPKYFFSRLHKYLTDHAYSNAETSDLWDALKSDEEDVGKFMSTWTNQPGFPFITVSAIKEKSFTVNQKRFLFSNLIDIFEGVDVDNLPIHYRPPNMAEQVWYIPLTFSLYSNSTGTPLKVESDAYDFQVLGDVVFEFDKEVPADSILLLNDKQTGVYRSLYEDKTYRYLIDWLHNDKHFLPAVERAGLYSDVFSMTFSGRLTDPTIAMELIKLLASETNILVWQTALKDLETLKDIFALHPSYGLMIKFHSKIIDSMVETIGWVETSSKTKKFHGRAKLRGRILREAIRNAHPATTKKALHYFKTLRRGDEHRLKVSPEAYAAIYDAGVMHGDQEDYNWVMAKYLSSTFAPEQQIYLHALASSPVPYIQQRTLSFAISGLVRQQDIITLIDQVATLTPVGHVSENWDKLTKGVYSETFGKFNKLLETICASFTKSYLIHEAERLFVRKEDPAFTIPPHADVSVLRGLETAKQLLAWREMNEVQVTEWLEKQ